VEYVEVTLDDIETANSLAHEVLGRTLDELPPQTRRLLGLVHELVATQCKAQAMQQSDYRFSRREIREATGWGNTQLKTHLRRLEDLEYLFVHQGRRGQSMVYELAYDGNVDTETLHLSGLIDVAALKCSYDKNKSGVNANLSGSSRPQVGPKSGGGRDSKTRRKPATAQALEPVDGDESENRGTPPKNNGRRNSVSRSSGDGMRAGVAMMAKAYE
jgi:hypothetical protein